MERSGQEKTEGLVDESRPQEADGLEKRKELEKTKEGRRKTEGLDNR